MHAAIIYTVRKPKSDEFETARLFYTGNHETWSNQKETRAVLGTFDKLVDKNNRISSNNNNFLKVVLFSSTYNRN